MVSRQLGTPQKQVVPRSPQMMRQSSPAGTRGAMRGGPRMQVVNNRGGQVVMGGRGRAGQVRMGAPMRGGRGQPMMNQQQRGQAVGRPIAGRGMMRGGQQQPQMVRGRGGMQVRGGGMQVRGGQQPQMRGGMQGMRGTPQQRMIRPAMAGQGGVRRGRPPGQLNNSAQQLQNQQYTNAALGIKPKPRQRAPAMQSMSGYQTQSMPAQNFTPRPIRPAAPQIIALPPAEIQSGGSSWHTPSQVGSSGGVSPPSSDITSFKIKLPSMTKKNDAPNGNIMAGVDPLAADPVVSLHLICTSATSI